METKKSHKPEALLDITVYRADGSVKEERSIRPEPQKPDTLGLVVQDYDGVIVEEKEFPVQSFVTNYSEQLYHSMIGGDSGADLTLTDGSSKEIATHKVDVSIASGNNVQGMQVGVGSTVVTVTDHKLAIIVANGTTANQLSYSQELFVATTTSGTDSVYKTYRTFENCSGGTITVKEVGLVGRDTDNRFLILRDVEDENSDPINVAVADAETLTAMYTFTCTQASGFTKQYLQLMESLFANEAVSIKYVGGGGSAESFDANYEHVTARQIQADAEEDDWGIVIGTDDSALDSTDYELGTLIAHGSSSGQLSYDEVNYEEVATSGDDITFVFKRTFTNLSGATIEIEEAGIYVEGRTETVYKFMIVRTLTDTLEIANGESVTVKYTFKHTV